MSITANIDGNAYFLVEEKDGTINRVDFPLEVLAKYMVQLLTQSLEDVCKQIPSSKLLTLKKQRSNKSKRSKKSSKTYKRR